MPCEQTDRRKSLATVHRRSWCLVIAYLAGFLMCPISVECQMRGGFKPRKVLRRPMRPIVNPKTVPAGETSTPLRDDELVLGVVVGGEARAYPINMLTGPSREIINDRLGGRDIAATW